MKLIYGPACHDAARLWREGRYCACGQSWGRYRDDGLVVEISGAAVPLGSANSQFQCALQYRPIEGQGKIFDAFAIPVRCDTVREVVHWPPEGRSLPPAEKRREGRSRVLRQRYTPPSERPPARVSAQLARQHF